MASFMAAAAVGTSASCGSDGDTPASAAPGADAAADGTSTVSPDASGSGTNRPRRDGPSAEIKLVLMASASSDTTILYMLGGLFAQPSHPCAPAAARVVGPCEISTCRASAFYSSDTSDGGLEDIVYEPGTFASAGDLSFAGGILAGLGPLAPRSDGSYFRLGTGSPDLLPGSTASASASGAMIPSWGPVEVKVPRHLTLLAPAREDGGPVVIPLGADLEVAWSGGDQGATMSFGFSAGSDESIGCYFDAAAGRGTIPKEIVAEAHAAETGVPTISWGQHLGAKFTAGDYEGVFSIDAQRGAVATFR